ncbi:MAG: WXG100 family type VII secretion target [Lachnospiraceae bacterium]|nr:WXG100 family type VII secretion target [Lachnospiraceae bacterium]
MDSIKVDTAEVRRIAGEVDEVATDYESSYVNLLNNVSTFTSSDWKGDDANQFREKVEGFRDDLNKMKTLMNEYATALRQFATNYEETQERIKQQAQGLTE